MSEFTKTIIVDADGEEYTNIADAIDDLSTTGGRIIVERATDPYSINTSLTPVSNMEIIGNGAVKIIMTSNAAAFQITSKDRVTISGFEIEMSNASFSESAISIAASTNCRFEDLTIKATNSGASAHNGFNLVTSNEVQSNYNIIRNCHISGFEIGIRIHEGMYNIIDGCIFDEYNVAHENTRFGVSILRAASGTGHNIVTNCITNGIHGTGSTNPYAGIFIEKSDYNVVLGNIAAEATLSGINVKSATGTVIGGNVCDHNLGDGIRLSGISGTKTKYSAVTGNVLSFNGDFSGDNNIVAENYTQYNCIAGNICTHDHTGGYGIKTESGSDHTLIDGNICYNSAEYPYTHYPNIHSSSNTDVVTSDIGELA